MLARIPYREWKGRRPRLVSLGAALVFLAGITSLVGGLNTAFAPPAELPPLLAWLETLGVNGADLAASVQAVTLASTVVLFGIYVLMSSLVREGRNWARIAGVVLSTVALTAALLQGSSSQTLASLVAAAGFGLTFRHECSRYFKPRMSQYLGQGRSGY